MISLSNSIFYKRNYNEISKYTKYEKYLHLVNKNSNFKFSNEEVLFINPDEPNELTLIKEKYSVIVLTDIIENSDFVFELLNNLKKLLEPGGKLIISTLNTKWFFLSKIFELFNLKNKSKNTTYLKDKTISNIFNSVGFDLVCKSTRQIVPFKLFNIGIFLNYFFELFLLPFNLGIKKYLIFRNNEISSIQFKKTIVVPAKNEEGNIAKLFERIGNKENYEIIFSLGKSNDGTEKVVKNLIESNKRYDVKYIIQTKNGKANAVWEAVNISKGDYIAVLDADLSVDPEVIDDFFGIVEKNYADFINGTRLIYDLEYGSMRTINKIGNKIFQYIVRIIINRNLTDSLCGTKVFSRKLFNKINNFQKDHKLFDPFGDFDMLFTAAFTGEKILELPVHYKARTYGTTQISRFKDGFNLIKYLLKSFILFNTSRN